MSQIEESIPRYTWRDNKTVLWLVRVGFVLQFYIPAIVCCYIVYSTGTRPPFTMSEDDPLYADYHFGEYLSDQFFKYGIATLMLLVVQWSLFSLILRFAKLRFAQGVLLSLVFINILHALVWLVVMWPLTMLRLTPPTMLYIIALCIESKVSHNAPQPDTP
jgi:hypothetical protein